METDDLSDVRDRISRLLRTRDPAARDRLAVDLIRDAPKALRVARAQAARDAVDGGMRVVEYARSIGVSQAAVDHLLHRDRGTGRGHDRKDEQSDG